MSAELAHRLAIYLVADPDQTPRDLVEVVDEALTGGVTCVQLRAKRLTDREALNLAKNLGRLCAAHDALFIVNDRLDLALAAGAGGVHLGVDDMPVVDARRVAGNEFVIGFSPESDDQTVEARAAGANYLGVGPVFATVSKADAGSAIGLPSVERRARLAGIPIIGIGGITTENASQVVNAGAVGVAVISAILRSDDPRGAARTLYDAVTGARTV